MPKTNRKTLILINPINQPELTAVISYMKSKAKAGPILHAVYDDEHDCYILLNGSHRATAASMLNYTVKLILHKKTSRLRLKSISGLTPQDCGGTFNMTVKNLFKDADHSLIVKARIKILKKA